MIRRLKLLRKDPILIPPMPARHGVAMPPRHVIDENLALARIDKP